MALSWNKIKDRALKFSNEWMDETRERAEKDSFWNDFFEVFGISRRRVATFEEPVKKLGHKQGFIDLFWKGTLLVEHKSKGKNLDEHLNQFPYVNGGLFEEFLPIAAFNSKMRAILLEASALDWGKISPAIFGSLFQSVMNPEEKRNLGAHYTSEMHMEWVKDTCGRLESRFRYSKDVVYNNYPWANDPSDKNIKKVEEKAQKVLDVRAEFPESSLADLYHPLTMPPKLAKAHQQLDKAVDLCYRPQAFTFRKCPN